MNHSCFQRSLANSSLCIRPRIHGYLKSYVMSTCQMLLGLDAHLHFAQIE